MTPATSCDATDPFAPPRAPATSASAPEVPPRELVESLYADLRAIAATYFSRQAPGHTLQPTALVNEAMLKLLRDEGGVRSGRWSSPGHFLAVAATAMRQILVDYARASGSIKRGGRHQGVQLDSSALAAPCPTIDVLELNSAIEALTAVDPRAAHVVVMRFFAGLTIAQTADAIGVSDFTIENDWRFARAFLAQFLAPPAAPATSAATREDGDAG